MHWSLLIFVSWMNCLNANDGSLVVKTKEGYVRGSVLTQGLISWLGIPYAKEPKEHLRFKRPIPVSKRQEGSVYEALKFPDACSQFPPGSQGTENSFPDSFRPENNVSENCLYLNIHRPRGIKKKLPVMVWIHGGGYQSQSMSLDLLDPSQIVKMGHIVFVALQYRLGALGFLFLGKNSSASGNMGLYDQAMALQWIHDNIEAFGGNPHLITLSGNSAGAHSIAIHSQSSLTRHLFHRAILQSSGLLPLWWNSNSSTIYQHSTTLLKLSQCQFTHIEESIDCLRSTSLTKLVELQGLLKGDYYSLVPVIDDEIISKSPLETLKALYSPSLTSQNSFSILTGSNQNEMFSHLIYLLQTLYPFREMSLKERNFTFEMYWSTLQLALPMYSSDLRNQIISYYDSPKNPSSTFYFENIERVISDAYIICDVESYAQGNSVSNSPVYRYDYTHRASNSIWPSWSGSKHTDEIEFVFGVPLRSNSSFTPSEVHFSSILLKYWTNFVKYGNPNGKSDDLPIWPKYNKHSNWKYINLNDNRICIEEDKIAKRCEFLNNILLGK